MDKEQIKNLLKKEWHLPFAEKAHRVIERFTLTEKVIFYFFVGILFVSGLSLLWQVNKQFLVEVPDYGGSLTEGVIGSARFVNPLLAISDADRDLTALLYSGLLKVAPDGKLIPDLAQSYTISDDGLTYTVVINKKATFHDGTPVTADDVIFTVEKAKDTTLKSPRKTNWDGVTAKKMDDLTVQFTLKQAYSPFIQNLTLGILPKHIWKNASADEFPFSQLNIKAVGSGPYQIDHIVYTSSGLPSEYHLTSFKNYTLGRPYIDTVIVKSYQNENDLISAYNNGSIDSIHGISPDNIKNVKKGGQKIISPLPRIFGVFFNPNVAPVFVNAEVRQALNMVTDKNEIINSVLSGYGQGVDQPIPPQTISDDTTKFDVDAQIAQAKQLLISKGWKQNASGIFEKKDKKSSVVLSFSISTSDVPELKKTAQILQKQWQKLGALVDVKIFEASDLNQNIIRTRKYDALLFGEVISREMDLYPFWHSSQRLDPGLNIALYTNLKADSILENLRKTTDPHKQKDLYTAFNKEISHDSPAVFIYSPYFIYFVPEKVHNVHIGELAVSSERFSDISNWYIETNDVWSIFIKK